MTIQGNDDQPAITLDLDSQGRYLVTIHDGHGESQAVRVTEDGARHLHQQAAALLAQQSGAQEPNMGVHVTRHRWANMGDHAVLAYEAVKYDPTETVESLILRVLSLRETFQRHDPMDHITLRVVEGTEPVRETPKWPSPPL